MLLELEVLPPLAAVVGVQSVQCVVCDVIRWGPIKRESEERGVQETMPQCKTLLVHTVYCNKDTMSQC